MIAFGLRTLFVLIALAVCAGHATQAQAACGDWLAEHGSRTDQGQAAPDDAPPRCSGPSCQQSPLQEPRSPLSEVTISVDKAALMAESLIDLLPDARDRFGRPASEGRLPNLLRSLIDRPPRV